MPTLTTSHHVAQALRALAATNKYLGIGRTTAWADELSPPLPAGSATALTEPVCYAPLSRATLVVPDVAGDLAFDGATWRTVSPANAYAEGAVRLYLEGRLEYDDAPLVVFRQVGFFTGLTPATGAGAGVLLPSQVADPGVLEVLDHRRPVYRAADKVDIVAVMVQF